MSGLSRLNRAEMRDIAQQLIRALQDRAAAGPPEAALDEFIPLLTAVSARLNGHVDGGEVADAARRTQLVQLDEADDDVDTWLRHVESYLEVEALRRTGDLQGAVKALQAQAFPDGLEPIRAYVPDENRYCRTALSVLGSAEHAPTVLAIRLPSDWLTQWAAAIEESEAAFAAASKARLARSQHVNHALDAQGEFVEVARRLRRYVQSRASSRDKARVAEGEMLLSPLTVPLKKLRTEARARATLREKAAQTMSAGQVALEGPTESAEAARGPEEGSADRVSGPVSSRAPVSTKAPLSQSAPL
ncbi:hypothetical protein [Chondromyces crocatus]|uniref:Uncharacterized protein n=1 Tax=Chondromyces crocatus TaxID=52 RepID=A0A0K1EF44_CHOCO|nr:hypothetical protein [Chondromyces crocatus]AKT39188.1 uncharacterized protein CMC5_033350 [Chondromyces crocatus]